MKLAAINTIGLTGAEILAAEMARLPSVLMLPGQNFISFGPRCYRPHEYAGWTPEAVFDDLWRHHYTRSGQCWAGLTKTMSPELLARYSKDNHKQSFVKRANPAATTIDQFHGFALAYADALGIDASDKTHYGFFGHNIVVNASHYREFDRTATVLDFANPLDYWLANIGQRMVWNNVQAMRFWIVNTLFVRRWAQRHPQQFAGFDIRQHVGDPDATQARLRGILGVDDAPSEAPPDGFIQFSPRVFAWIDQNAADLRLIYGDRPEFRLGMALADWCDGFLALPEVNDLLDRYERFWNSTSHTNLDWVGPIEEEIVRRALAHTGTSAGKTNPSFWFYHECFDLDSDNWERPTVRVEHYLGDLEEEIVLPQMPYYARAVVSYLDAVAGNTIKRAYSALPIRESSLYKRLAAENYRRNFARWALEETFVQLEAKIDAADAAIAQFC